MPRWLLPLLVLASCRTPAPARAATSTPAHAPPATVARAFAIIHDQHCGGALLTPEEEALLERPAANVTFLVFAGDRNTSAPPVARLTTDARGGFDVPLVLPGRYCVVRADRALTKEEEARLLALPPPKPRPPLKPGETWLDPDCLARLPLQCDAPWTYSPEASHDIWLPGTECSWSKPCVVSRGVKPP